MRKTAIVMGLAVLASSVWAEPEAFGGCSTQGQSKPDQPQPLHFVRTPRAERAPEGVSA